MKSANVHIGDVYAIRISGKEARVRIHSKSDSDILATNVKTGRLIRLRSARRLRYNVTLFEEARTHYEDRIAGRPALYGTRTIKAGDLDGCEGELQRLAACARQAELVRRTQQAAGTVADGH